MALDELRMVKPVVLSSCQVMKGAAGDATIVAGEGVVMLKRPGDTITETGGMASITTRGPDDIIVHGADTDSAE